MVRNRVAWSGSGLLVMSAATLLLLVEALVNWYRRTTDQKVRGSNPFGRTSFDLAVLRKRRAAIVVFVIVWAQPGRIAC